MKIILYSTGCPRCEVLEKKLAAAGIEPVKSNRGAVMKIVMPQFKGKADMKVVNQVVGEILQ